MELSINLGTCSYPIIIESGLKNRISDLVGGIGAQRLAIVTDETVWGLHGAHMQAQLGDLCANITILSPGENAKNHDNLLMVYRNWLNAGLTRSDLVVAFGGGVIGDLTGYAAATYLRGIPFVQIPTTLLSQVDSSIGGKVAVNLPEGKNLVGTFYHPQAVWIDTSYLKTLTTRVRNDGMAEVAKAGCIADRTLYTSLLEYGFPQEDEQLVAMIAKALMVKKKLVEEDEKEIGPRKLLNFGHTMGHALEAYGGYKRWTHGEAVSMGMVWITRCSEARGLTQKGSAAELEILLRGIGLPTEADVELSALLKWLMRDKKKTSKGIDLALIREPGDSFLHEIPQGDIEAFFK